MPWLCQGYSLTNHKDEYTASLPHSEAVYVCLHQIGTKRLDGHKSIGNLKYIERNTDGMSIAMTESIVQNAEFFNLFLYRIKSGELPKNIPFLEYTGKILSCILSPML